MNTQVIEFLTSNPNSTQGQIAYAINLRGLGLFNLLKKMVNYEQIVVEGEGHDATYVVADTKTDEVLTEVQTIVKEAINTEETTVDTIDETTVEDAPINEETNVPTTEKQSEPPADVLTAVNATPAKAQAGRNTGTYKFNGTSYTRVS